jgi:hypothetical protein
MSPCRCAKEVVVIVAIAIIFIGCAMERPNSPYFINIIGEKKRKQIPNTKKLAMENNLNQI